MRAKRILHVIETLGHGGAEHQVAVVAASLERASFESTVCHLYQPDYLARPLREAGIAVHGLGLTRSKKHWPEAIARLLLLIRKLKPDLIHTSLFEADLLGGAAAKIAGVPCVNTLCNMGSEPEKLIDNEHMSQAKLYASSKLWGGALRHLHRHSIAISRAVMESAERSYGLSPERMTVVYRAYLEKDSGPTDSAALEQLRRDLGLSERSPILLNIGRLAPQKGQRYLIQAMPDVVRALPKAVLLIVGDGWLRPALEGEAKERGVMDHVRFLGRREDTRALLELADVFVFPSLFEGLGVSLIEAAGAGRASIASRVGPIPEVIEDGVSGVLVPPRSPSALSAAIVDLAQKPGHARAMGEAARARIRADFTVHQMVDRLEGVYRKVLSESARA